MIKSGIIFAVCAFALAAPALALSRTQARRPALGAWGPFRADAGGPAWRQMAWQQRDRQGPPPRAGRRGGPPPRFVDQLSKLPPQERERVLENNRRFQQLPPAQQQLLRDRLQQLQGLTPEQRELIQQRFAIFSNLTPGQQQKARQLYENTWSKLNPERRRVLLNEFRQLRTMSPTERQQRLSSQDFQSRFNPQEQDLLKQLSTM